MPEIDFRLDIAGRIALYEVCAERCLEKIREAGEDQSGLNYWGKEFKFYKDRIRELKGAEECEWMSGPRMTISF